MIEEKRKKLVAEAAIAAGHRPLLGTSDWSLYTAFESSLDWAVELTPNRFHSLIPCWFPEIRFGLARAAGSAGVFPETFGCLLLWRFFMHLVIWCVDLGAVCVSGKHRALPLIKILVPFLVTFRLPESRSLSGFC